VYPVLSVDPEEFSRLLGSGRKEDLNPGETAEPAPEVSGLTAQRCGAVSDEPDTAAWRLTSKWKTR
jgi:hypothetical protein